jgi:hypothetical protein
VHQIDLFPSAGKDLERRVRALDLDRLTPLQAFGILVKWKNDIDKKEK